MATNGRNTSVPWDEAVKMVGEEQLKEGRAHSLIGLWRRRGVPARVMLEMVQAKVNDQRLEVVSIQEAARVVQDFLAVPGDAVEALGMVRKLWKRTGGKGPHWEALRSFLHALDDAGGERGPSVDTPTVARATEGERGSAEAGPA